MGDPYPAVDIFDAFTADQAQHKPLGTHYRESAAEGLSDGVRELTEIASEQDAIGPNWKLVLIGYSQGADVMRQIMAALPAAVVSHIAAAVLFGDPYFEAHEANVMAFGGIRPNIGEFQPHAIGVARFAAGVGQAPQPQPLRVPTYSWCNDHDLVCGLNVSLGRLLPQVHGVVGNAEWGKIVGIILKHWFGAETAGHFAYPQEACLVDRQVIGALNADGLALTPSAKRRAGRASDATGREATAGRRVCPYHNGAKAGSRAGIDSLASEPCRIAGPPSPTRLAHDRANSILHLRAVPAGCCSARVRPDCSSAMRRRSSS